MARNLWTIKEIDYLKRSWPTSLGFDEIKGNLPGRSDWSIRNKASRLGLSRPFYSHPDIYKSIKCWGKEFDQDCVDKCPDWYNCLNDYAENQKKNIIIEDNKAVIVGPTTGGQLIEALRGLKRID